MTRLVLHYAPDNASLAVRLALEMAGLAYSTQLVDRRARAQRSPAYLRLNPMGHIPVLETGDGVMFETGAILLWITEQAQGLIPPPGDADRGRALTWLFWLSNSLHPALRARFYPDVWPQTPPEAARNRILDLFDIAEAHLAPTLAGWPPGVIDCYLAPILRWCAIYPRGGDWPPLDRWPGLQSLAARIEGLPCTAAAIRAEGLGPYPFTAPVLPDPPEGSAT